jgi:DNA-binding transcriptional MocR family regulator
MIIFFDAFCYVLQLQGHYRRQRDVFVTALDKYVPSGLCTYTRPTGGMFLWLTFPTLGHVTTHQLFEAFAKADVIIAPGTGFYVPGIHELLKTGVVPTVNEAESARGANITQSSGASPFPCVRACYAAATAERIVQAVQAMAQCVIALHETGVAGAGVGDVTTA